MKILNTTDNYINTTYGSNWLYTSDKPIDSSDYYYEIEISSYSEFSSGNFGFVYKGENGFSKNGLSYSYNPSFIFLLYPYENNEYMTVYGTRNLILEYDLSDYSSSYFLNKRIGLRIKQTNDNLIFYVYLNGVLLYQIDPKALSLFGNNISINNFYIGSWNQWNHNQITAKFYFDDDCIYLNKYLVEDTNSVYNLDSEDNLNKISDTLFEKLDKETKLSLIQKGNYEFKDYSLTQLKSLKQPIKIIKKK